MASKNFFYKKSYSLGAGLALNQFSPWYGGLFFSIIVFFFTYFVFYKFDFYFFLLFFILLCATVSVTAFSVINALIFLIITYLFSSFVFFLAGLDFLALALIFIYVGAIAILFLFVVMTLTNEKITRPSSFNFLDCLVFSIFFIFLFFFLVITIQADFYHELFYRLFLINGRDLPTEVGPQFDPLIEIGLLLYGKQAYLFFIISLILFLGFFCPIILTLEEDDLTRLPSSFSLNYPYSAIQQIKIFKDHHLSFFKLLSLVYFFVWFTYVFFDYFFN